MPCFRMILEIEPIPKGRPRFSIIGGGPKRRVIARTPARTQNFENAVREHVVLALNMESKRYPLFPKGVPVAIDVDFIFPRPANLQRLKDPFGYIWKPNVPDLDNLQKAVFDALNEIIWHDDSQIIDLRTRKMYSDKVKGRKGLGLEGKEKPCIAFYIRRAPDDPCQVLCCNTVKDRLAFDERDGVIPEEPESSAQMEFPSREVGDVIELFVPVKTKPKKKTKRPLMGSII